jgi:hypothetical protein
MTPHFQQTVAMGRLHLSRSQEPDTSLVMKIGGVLLLSYLCVSCVPTSSYQANEQLVGQLGITHARQSLDEVMARSLNPRVTSVEVTDDFVLYRYQQPLHGPWGIQTGTVPGENRIFFTHIGGVEIYENHLVQVRTAEKRVLGQLVFATDQDARAFADLIMSFRAQRARTN